MSILRCIQRKLLTTHASSTDRLTQLNQDVTPSLSTSQSDQISAVVCDVAATTATRVESNREDPDRSGSSQPCQKPSLDDVNEPSLFSPDVWSFAFREALNSVGSDIDVAILQGENATTLLKGLQDLDRESSQESAFRRGVEHLQRLKIPLETIKLALDIATPVAAIEPTASMAIGVVRSVTAVSLPADCGI